MWELGHKEGWRPKNQCLKEIKPEYSLKGLMLKLKFQYFGHLMWRADSLEKTLMLENIEGRGRRGWQILRWLDGIIHSMDMSLSKLQEIVREREAWHAVAYGVEKSCTWMRDWTTNICFITEQKNKARLEDVLEEYNIEVIRQRFLIQNLSRKFIHPASGSTGQLQASPI